MYNGVPGPVHVTPARSELGNSIRVLYVGRLSERKGVDVAVDAIAGLQSRGIDASLDIVGAVFPGYEWFQEKLEAQIQQLGLGSSVIITVSTPRCGGF